jgi:hypothetical protein
MVLFILLVVFCIFFGVDIANRGMERIQGQALPAAGGAQQAADIRPAPQPQPTPQPQHPAVKAPGPSALAAKSPPPAEPVLTGQDEALNYVGNKIGDLLQIAAHHAIRAVVSLFSALIG